MKYKRVIIADAIAFYNVETSAVNIITMADYQSDNFDRIVSISKAAELAGFGRIHFAKSRQFMLAHPDTGLGIYDTIRKINCDVSTTYCEILRVQHKTNIIGWYSTVKRGICCKVFGGKAADLWTRTEQIMSRTS